MSKFADAFQRGQAACDSTERAKEEIRGVFHGLSEDIAQQTQGLVSMSVLPPDELGEILEPGGLGQGAVLPSENKDDALVATAGAGRPVPLCTVKQGPQGYPVVLAFPGHSLTAHNRVALENALGSVLAYPDVAGKLKHAMDAAKGAGASAPPPGPG